MVRMDVLFSARTTTGMIVKTTRTRTAHSGSLLRKRSLEPDATMAVCRESNAEVDKVTVMTRTRPTTQAGSWARSKKSEMEPGDSGSSGTQAPDQAATRPAAPTTVRVMVTKIVARETPIQRSLSVLEANVRSQRP